MPTITSPLSLSPLQVALADSIHNVDFADTVYYLFSSHLPSGKVGKLQPIFANSHVLKAAGQHFRGQLSAGFQRHHDLPVDIGDYDYEDDSDLEDSEEVLTHDDVEFLSAGSSTSVLSVKDKDSDSSSSLVDRAESLTLGTSKLPVPADANRFKHVVVVTDVAATTWCALMFYIYTGKIEFAPLRSEGVEKREEFFSKYGRNPFALKACSPKSMYRLADIVGLDDLKLLAFEDIQSKLYSTTILTEAFSLFTSRFPQIMEAEVKSVCDLPPTSLVMRRLEEKMSQIVRGDLPCAQAVVMALLKQLLRRNEQFEVAQWEIDSSPGTPRGMPFPSTEPPPATAPPPPVVPPPTTTPLARRRVTVGVR
ncbi:hypothetical protein EUX98_g4490 [Antrodiella citrinella]|uniref:BTB domain-containing protein n=1 Tax=Antrodiella citrinella TaxID=2447956 RepID=A0A4S4MU12_9APHY|nr:hypothetical protein EUX98_g4490 [Antrodiella citrinella]